MWDKPTQRRLAAVLAADIAGYTRLMEQDTDGTVAAWHDARANVIDPQITAHAGRIVKHTGDGFLAEFPTVQDAVKCAVAMQEGLVGSTLDFRMGVNLGDIIDDGEDIHGEGVNVAARLEGLAERGGICVSGDVFNQVRNRIDAKFDDKGEQEVKHVSAPIHVYAIRLEAATISHLDSAAVTDKPSIAVLPFDNLSGDPEQAYFADGMAEEVITALSHYRWFFVIARNSSFTYKGRAVDARQVGQELGVRYLLEGSVRKAGNRIRVTAQLIDARTGNHIWAERYDRELNDIFALQDEITESIVATVEPELGAIEREQARRKLPENLDAWGSYQRGLWHLYGDRSRDGLAEARRLFQRACDLDPEFATAYAELAWTHTLDITRGFADARNASLGQASVAAEKAVALDARDPVARFALGRVHVLRHEYEEAIAEMEAALSLNSNFDRAYYGLGMALLYGGRPEESIPQFEQAIRLNPRSPLLWHYFYTLARAYFNMGRDEKALAWSGKANQQPNAPYWSFAVAAAALGHLNRIDEAGKMLTEVRNRKADFSANSITSTVGPYGPHSGAGRIIEGLRKAGLPEA